MGLLLYVGNNVCGIFFFVVVLYYGWYIDCVFFDIIDGWCSFCSVCDLCGICLVIFCLVVYFF